MLYYVVAAVCFVLAQLAWFLLGKVICRVRDSFFFFFAISYLYTERNLEMNRIRMQRSMARSSRPYSKLPLLVLYLWAGGV